MCCHLTLKPVALRKYWLVPHPCGDIVVVCELDNNFRFWWRCQSGTNLRPITGWRTAVWTRLAARVGRALEVQGRQGAVEVAVIPQPVAPPHNPKTRFTTALLGKYLFNAYNGGGEVHTLNIFTFYLKLSISGRLLNTTFWRQKHFTFASFSVYVINAWVWVEGVFRMKLETILWKCRFYMAIFCFILCKEWSSTDES